MIELLKSGKQNNRLLSPMALHKDFQRLMVDIEIFVDRIADMRINDMSTMLESSRKKIMQQYNPGENELYISRYIGGQIWSMVGTKRYRLFQ